MFKKLAIKILYRLLFKNEFDKELDDEKRFKILRRLWRDQEVVGLWRSMYTRAYKSISVNWSEDTSPYVRGVYTGRLIQLQSELDQMQNADENLENIESVKAKKEQFKKVFNLGGKITHLIKKPF